MRVRMKRDRLDLVTTTEPAELSAWIWLAMPMWLRRAAGWCSRAVFGHAIFLRRVISPRPRPWHLVVVRSEAS